MLLPELCVAETRRGGTSPAFQLLDLEQNPSPSARKHFLNGLLEWLAPEVTSSKCGGCVAHAARRRRPQRNDERNETTSPPFYVECHRNREEFMEREIDRPDRVRRGEELDVDRLREFLRGRIEGFDGPLTVEQFPGGYSNLTYLVRSASRELVVRRPPFGNTVSGAHDMLREYRVLRGLHGLYAPAPEAIVACEDPDVIGAPFFGMERRVGVIIRAKADDGPKENGWDPAWLRAVAEALTRELAALHSVDATTAGLADLGRPAGYVERQVRGWTRRLADAQTGDSDSLESVATWLADHLPNRTDAALIHNDFKYDNVVLDPDDPTRIVGVLDWEMATIGDPLADLGTTLAYWIESTDDPSLRQAAFGPTAVPGNWTRRDVVEQYARATGRDVEGVHYYYVLGLFKIAGIVQQIYARYVRGHTRDERFANLAKTVDALGAQARAAIARREV